MRILLTALYCVLTTISTFGSETFPLWGRLVSGPYAVGFAVRSQYDYSRTFRSKISHDGRQIMAEAGRPIQILVWYPAETKAGSRRMRYREYVHLITQELDFKKPGDDAKKRSEEKFIKETTLWLQWERKPVETLLDSATAATADAPAAEGAFPLVLYAPGQNGYASENSSLCEYLASHGYVVASIPSFGTDFRREPADLKEYSRYARDIEFTVAAMRSFPHVDAACVGLAGFSMGGHAITLVQMRNTLVQAIVCLDSGLPYAQYMDYTFAHAPDFDRTALRMPQLCCVRKTPQVKTDFASQIPYADIYALFGNRDYFRHSDFAENGLLSGVIPGLHFEHAKERQALNETVNRYTLQFLNAHLKKDARGAEFLKKSPQENGVPDGLIEWSHKPAFPPPPYLWEIADLFRGEGSQKFRQVYAKFWSPGSPPLAETALNAIGYELLMEGNDDRAIEAFAMNVELFPRSVNALDSLSEAYEIAGDKEKSIQCAKKGLDLLPVDASLDESKRQGFKDVLEERIKRIKN